MKTGILEDPERDLVVASPSRRLVVLLHAAGGEPGGLAAVARAARSALPDADQYRPRLPIQVMSRVSGEAVVAALVAAIGRLVAQRARRGDGYREIVLVGHSAGAVLARAVWATAHGAGPDARIAPGARLPWADCIRRIVLIAAVNRGWSPDAPVSPSLRVASWLGSGVERALGPEFFMLGLRRGAPFLTTVRLQALEVARALADEERSPTVVQLLGTVDDVVAPSDNIDLATGRDFFYREVPASGHIDIIDLENPVHGAERRGCLVWALTAVGADLRSRSIPPEELDEVFGDPEGDRTFTGVQARRLDELKEVEHVLFVVHGIRDYGFWTRKLAAYVRRQSGMKDRLRTVTASYGFFPIAPFLLRAERRRRTEWLLDKYVTARALFPNRDAVFSFVGHSNGTYLLAAALRACRAVRFDRVAFAGSVVRSDFPWGDHLASCPGATGQVGALANFVATGDWVLAGCTKGLQAWGLADLGSAGHDGFDAARTAADGLAEVRFTPGSHGAAIGEQHWGEIAAFVLRGDPPSRAGQATPVTQAVQVRAARQEAWVVALGRLSWALVLAAPLVGIAAIRVTLRPVAALARREPEGTARALSSVAGLLAFYWLVRRALTRL